MSDFVRQTEVFVARHCSPQAVARLLAQTARDGTAELIRSRRASPRFIRYVDGRANAAAESVKANGVIVDVFDNWGDIITFAIAFLRKRAPHDSGDYVKSFFLGLDGKMVDADAFNPRTVGSLSEVIIGNTQPYNRLVDVQLAGRNRIRFSVPEDIFRDAGRAIEREFKRAVMARREYNLDFPGKHRLTGRGPSRGKLVESPGLILTPRR